MFVIEDVKYFDRKPNKNSRFTLTSENFNRYIQINKTCTKPVIIA